MYYFGFESFFLKLVDLKAVLNKDVLIMERNDPSLNQYQEVEGFIQKLFRLELHFLLIHLFAKIASAGFISGYQIY